jgi:two-component sensor histidine kinase
MIHFVFGQYLQEKRRNEELLVQAIRDKDELEKSNECNRVLLKEVYHRTKNNMLVIISMLNLRAMNVEDPNFRQLAMDTENKIRAMALVHEQLYQSENLRNLDFEKYLRNMAKTLVSSATNNDQIEVEIDCNSQTLSIDIAVPLGLVINEIITNALKHAFPDNMKGKIQITMRAVDINNIELSIGDNGIGLPDDFNPVLSKSLGMQINNSIIKQQLKGTIDISKDNGTRYTICLPRDEHNLQN